VSILIFRWMVSNLIAPILMCTLAGQVCNALQSASQQMFDGRVYIDLTIGNMDSFVGQN
jgi:hypothetical protein